MRQIAPHLESGLSTGPRKKVRSFHAMIEGLAPSRHERLGTWPSTCSRPPATACRWPRRTPLRPTRDSRTCASFSAPSRSMKRRPVHRRIGLPVGLPRTRLARVRRRQLDETGRVAMMTVHGAKGLEFDVVLLTGMEEDMFPYRSSNGMNDPGQLEEERRLGYVAMTRARKQLFVIHTAVRNIFGTTRYGRPRRFLSNLPGGRGRAHELTGPGLRGIRLGAGPSAGRHLPRARPSSWHEHSREPQARRALRGARPRRTHPLRGRDHPVARLLCGSRQVRKGRGQGGRDLDLTGNRDGLLSRMGGEADPVYVPSASLMPTGSS